MFSVLLKDLAFYFIPSKTKGTITTIYNQKCDQNYLISNWICYLDQTT